MTINFKLTEEQFNKLFDGNTSVSEMKNLHELLEKRLTYIIGVIDSTFQRARNWFDFDNESESNKGYFDPEMYTEEIFYTGSLNSQKHADIDAYSEYFPTLWLKNDFEEELQKEFNQIKLDQEKERTKEKTQKEKAKQNFEIAKASILLKLTPDELKYISFNTTKEILEMVKKEEKKALDEKKRQEHLKKIQPYLDAKNDKKKKP